MQQQRGHRDWCVEAGRPGPAFYTAAGQPIHDDGTTACAGPLAELGGLTLWLTQTAGGIRLRILGDATLGLDLLRELDQRVQAALAVVVPSG